MKIAIMQFPHVIAKEVRLKQSVHLHRHCEGGTTEAICLIEGQIASAPSLNANPIPRNDV